MLLSLLSKRSLEVDSRDAYGFALRPQHVQGYKDYVFIYKEEEDERSDRWKTFLEHQLKSACPSSPEDVCIETSHAEATTQKEEIVSDRSEEGDGTSSHESASSGSTEKEVESTKETKRPKVQTWVQIKPSLGAIDHMMGSRVKTRKDMIDEQKNDEGDHLSSSTEVKPVRVVHEENFENSADKVPDDTEKHSTVRRDEGNGLSSEPSFPWKEELECLVRGGVPKELRGEVWQAFLGVRTRRVERYYEDLLADTDARDINKHDSSPGTPTHWIKQIEKDIPRTFPGHPALDDNGRNSLRRLLLAYSRHNPSVGYCQAMNYFAGLLLLLMPEENAFWALVGIIDDYFEGYYTEQMIESQVDQLVLEELVHERFPKLVNHLDYLGVQVTWITASWFLSIFVNMLPWESVLRVWDVLLYEGNRVMLFRSALALIELYGPALATTKDAGDAITLLQSLAGSTFDGSQLVMTACMSFQLVTEARLQELREKHRPTVLRLIEERTKRTKALMDSRGVKSKLYSLKQDHAEKEIRFSEGLADDHTDGDASYSESPSDVHEYVILPDLQEQVDRLKVEICKLLEDNRSAELRAEVLETALAEMAKEDNRPLLITRIEQLEEEIEDLRKILHDKEVQEVTMIEVLLRVQQQQKATEDARILAERNAATQQSAVNLLERYKVQDKYEKALSTVAWMEKKVIMAESMLEATLQYECGQIKAQASPGHSGSSSREISSPSNECHSPTKEGPVRNMSLLSRSFALGWGDKNKGNATNPQTNPED